MRQTYRNIIIFLIALLLVGVGALVVTVSKKQFFKNKLDTANIAPIETEVVTTTVSLVSPPLVTISTLTPEGKALLTVDDTVITFTGFAVGTMFFEGSFPVSIRDQVGTVLAEGIAEADDEWMTTSTVPFTATMLTKQTIAAPISGDLVLKKDNPSGLAEHDVTITVPFYLEKNTNNLN